jgi:hypothetical protein
MVETKKPVREILQDVQQTARGPRPRRGFFPPGKVDRVSFISAVCSVVAVSGILLLMIWEAINSKFGIQIMATIGVVQFAILIFRSLNTNYPE